jgi:hypothetical protein
MSKNIIFVLMHHGHKILEIVVLHTRFAGQGRRWEFIIVVVPTDRN